METVLRGAPAAPGIAAGKIRVLSTPDVIERVVAAGSREESVGEAHAALSHAGSELEAIGVRLREEGREAEAEIVELGALMAADPSLRETVSDTVRGRDVPAPVALVEAADRWADRIAAVEDPVLAARAEDLRSLGRRAARIAAEGPSPAPRSESGELMVAADLGPADVAELGPQVRAIAAGSGSATAHAAIIARSLGLPMVSGLGEAAHGVASGALAVLDGDEGALVLQPGPARLARARAAAAAQARQRRRAFATRALSATTGDGRRIAVLANASTALEVIAALEAGAEGVGLLRTELTFLDATAWPTEAQHLRALIPVLHPLRGLPATVRLLDFGGDKAPSFLRGSSRRGLELLLGSPEALAAQLRAVLRAGSETRLRLLLPMVRSVSDVKAVEAALSAAVDAVPGALRPALGAMIELTDAVEAIEAISRSVDFLSIGTNDLTDSALGGDRFSAGEAATHDPVVLGMIARVAAAAEAARVPLEVCGEAASDPRLTPLLVGMGVSELSVGAARVGSVRSWIRSIEYAETAAMANAALRARAAAEVSEMMEPVGRRLGSLDQTGDALRESDDRSVSVASVPPEG